MGKGACLVMGYVFVVVFWLWFGYGSKSFGYGFVILLGVSGVLVR